MFTWKEKLKVKFEKNDQEGNTKHIRAVKMVWTSMHVLEHRQNRWDIERGDVILCCCRCASWCSLTLWATCVCVCVCVPTGQNSMNVGECDDADGSQRVSKSYQE